LKPSATRSAYHFDVTNEMIPNVYVDITYVQGREKKNNDLPLRLYGVIPVYVEDKNIKLLPRIVMPNQIKPNENFSIEVSEELSREMAYQIFIVDEGLLNLTRFKTPDPYNDIMSKEALTILSYDNFNDVIGHMDGELEKVFSVGGDLAVNTNQLVKNKRFTPVVMRTEASLLKKGERKKHVFNIANYIGAVRVMVIANSYGKFGSTDKTVEVKKDLMTQVAFPRVMSCNDEVLVPVTVFSANPAIKEVSVRIDCKGEIKLVDDRIKKINFTRPGDQTIYFKVKGNNKIGNAEVNIQANSGSELATSSVSFFVDNLNPISHSVHNYWIEPGKTLREVITPYGMDGTRKVQLEVSGFQGLSVDKLKSELMQYPHGCLEQIVSAAFPQLYLAGLMNADAKQGELIYKHVQSAIEKLRRYQSLHGVFLYWPGGDQLSEWAHSYAGHFLIESRNSGFNVPTDILQNWYKAQRTLSNTYRSDKAVKNYHRPQVFQAYRLFTLALYGQAEWSAMNALYQEKSTDFLTRVLLSGAYTLAGKNEIAEKLLSGSIPELPAYRENSFSFGSDVRDEAMMVMVLTLQNKNNEASKLLGKLLKRTSGNYRLSTQEMAMILMSAGKLYGNTRNVKLKFNHTWNGSLKTIESDYPVYITELKPDAKQYLEFTNHSAIPVSVSLLQSGKETINQQMDISKGITLNLEFNTANTNKSNLTSGDPVNTIITIHNTGQTGRIDNIALTAVFPAGLELDNRRIGGLESHNAKLDYEDYRDDRICYYFGLNAGESLRINVPLTSSYPGKFGPPVFICEAMYDPGVYAKKSLAPLQIFTRK
jgi:alpha-2-macroglobulin